jgi:hypothetical protein
MRRSQLGRSRFIVGLVLVATAVLLLLLGEGGIYTGGAIALGIVGLVSIAISRRK